MSSPKKLPPLACVKGDIIEYIVSLNEDGCRADRVVRALFKDVGYVFLQKLFRQGKVKVNGKKAKAGQRLKADDVLEICSNQLKLAEDEAKSEKKGKQLEVHKAKELFKEMLLFENEDFVALNKKAGLAVQLGSKVSFCVETILKSVLDRYYLVHRLDKDTTGVLLIAKTPVYARKLTQMFREGKIKKVYWAIVDGKIKDSGVIRNFLGKSLVSGEERVTIVKENQGKLAVTKYKPIERVGYFTLLELKPETGRKHQLRVHCSENLKAPILGDVKYNKNVQHKNLFLHAKKLTISDLNITIDAPLPRHFSEMFEMNEKNS